MELLEIARLVTTSSPFTANSVNTYAHQLLQLYTLKKKKYYPLHFWTIHIQRVLLTLEKVLSMGIFKAAPYFGGQKGHI